MDTFRLRRSVLENARRSGPKPVRVESVWVESFVNRDFVPGVVPHQQGRVLSSKGVGASGAPAEAVPGLYVVGWLKRGPTGIIGTNSIDAEETVSEPAKPVGVLLFEVPWRDGGLLLGDGRCVQLIAYFTLDPSPTFVVVET